jgi:uncharacterized protein
MFTQSSIDGIAKMQRVVNRLEGVEMVELLLNDTAHGPKHAIYVANRCIAFARQEGVSVELSYIAGICHDLKHHEDAHNHEMLGGLAFYANPFFKRELSEESRKLVKEAIEDHRSSLEGEPRSIYGRILSSADRTTDWREALRRCESYSKKHFPDLSIEQRTERAFTYIKEKYGEKGRAKSYFDDPAFFEMKKRLEVLTNDKRLFFHEYQRVCNE